MIAVSAPGLAWAQKGKTLLDYLPQANRSHIESVITSYGRNMARGLATRPRLVVHRYPAFNDPSKNKAVFVEGYTGHLLPPFLPSNNTIYSLDDLYNAFRAIGDAKAQAVQENPPAQKIASSWEGKDYSADSHVIDLHATDPTQMVGFLKNSQQPYFDYLQQTGQMLTGDPKLQLKVAHIVLNNGAFGRVQANKPHHHDQQYRVTGNMVVKGRPTKIWPGKETIGEDNVEYATPGNTHFFHSMVHQSNQPEIVYVGHLN